MNDKKYFAIIFIFIDELFLDILSRYSTIIVVGFFYLSILQEQWIYGVLEGTTGSAVHKS